MNGIDQYMLGLVGQKGSAADISALQLAATLESTPNVAVQWYDDEGRAVYWNPASETMFGWSKGEAIGRRLDALIHTAEEMQVFLGICRQLSIEGGCYGPHEFNFTRRDGSIGTCISTIFPIPDLDGNELFVCMDVDVTDKKLAEEKLKSLAYRDDLTGLYNRTGMIEQIAKCRESATEPDRLGAFLIVDVDHFKKINDALGSELGDELLRVIAERLNHALTGVGTMARISGDEFVIMIEQLGQRDRIDEAFLTRTADTVRRVLSRPFALGLHNFSMTVSMGGSFWQSTDTYSSIFRKLHLALHSAKATHRGEFHLYHECMTEAASERIVLEEKLRRAILERSLGYMLQPIFSSAGNVVGAELLVRWTLEDGMSVSPALFIPLAEETGLIHRVGDFVLDTACKLIKEYEASDSAFSGYLSVNVSAWEFNQKDYVQHVIDRLKRHRIDRSRILLEITEGSLLNNIDEAQLKIQALKEQGIRTALDDFGTGFSSLSYINKLPFSVLKIDQSFISEINEHSNLSVLKCIIGMAHGLGLGVISEGVETAYQHDLLCSMHCESCQGYYFSRPLPKAAFDQLLASKA